MQLLRRRSLVAVLMLAAGTPACKSIADDDFRTAETARVLITGSTTVPLTVITSTQFLVSRGHEGEELIGLVRADTAQLRFASRSKRTFQ